MRFLKNFKLINSIVLLFINPIINAQEAGFFLDDWEQKNAIISENNFIEKSEKSATVNIAINAGNVLKKIPKYIFGNNAVTWDSGLPNNSIAMTDLKNLNTHVLRWPGGNLSNNYFWNYSSNNPPDDIPDDIDPWYGQNTTWQLSVDEYYDLLEETNSTGIICVNYSYARYGTSPNPVANAAHMAAEWVRYDNGRSKFWEIGNENYGNWQAGYKIDVSQNQDGQPEYISGQLYGQHCKVFIDSMRAAASEIGVDIKIGVVVYDAEGSYDAISQVWNEGLMPEVGDLADFLAVHSYFTPYDENSSVSTILNSYTVPEEIMSVLETDMAEAEKTMLPVAMTEWNIFAVGSMQQVSYINGMLAALTLGEFVKNGYGLATRWDLVNGWSDGNDHGMFSVGGEPGVDPYNPRAVFFYMYYFQKYMGDNMVESSVTGSNDVVVHASTFSSGETGFVVVNKSKTTETALVNIENSEQGIRYYTYTLTGGDDNGDFSRKVLINGHETDEQGGGPDDYETIKAFSSRTRDGIKIDLPPLSVVYVVVDKKQSLSFDYAKVDTNANIITVELSEDVLPFESAPGFEVVVNSISPLTISSIERNENSPYIINLTVEQEIDNDDEITISYSGSNIVSSDSTELSAFTNEPASNLLPGDPLNIEFLIKNSASGEVIENCEVSFNNEKKTTDSEGKVTFIAPENNYVVSAVKLHLDDLINLPILVTTDTTIALYLDSTKYEVAFQIKDIQNDDGLSFVEIIYRDLPQQTNNEGKASLFLHAGEHSVQFSKLNFSSLNAIFQIDKDTSITVKLTRTHANVKFRLKNGEQPIKDALVILENDSLYTSSLGICIFESREINTNFGYVTKKDLYYQQEGNINCTSDTTLELQMEKSVANVEFIINTESGILQNAKAILNSDTADFDLEGHVKFYNLTKDNKYEFLILGDNFADYTDSIFVINDTVINIQIVISSIEMLNSSEKLTLFPNPASNSIHIKAESMIDYVEVITMAGTVISKLYCRSENNDISIINIPDGYYIIKATLLTNKKQLITPLIIKRNQ